MSLTVSVSDIVNQSTSELLGKHESWERVELGFIAKVLNGFAFDSANFSKERGIPLIRIRDISCNFTETQYDGPYDEVYLVSPNDLLVGMDGDFNSALWAGPVGLLNQRVCKIEVHEEFFSKKFLSYVLPGYLNAINDVTSSMTVKHLSSKSIEEIPLPLPPLPEQNRIVAAIEQQFTRLDNAVASLQSAKVRTKQYRASLLKAEVEGELTKEWRDAHSANETGAQLLARILAERRACWEEEQQAKMRERGITPKDDKWKQAYKEPQGPDVDVEQLLALPKEWCWATLDQISLLQRGRFSIRPRNDPRYYNGSHPFIQIGDLPEEGGEIRSYKQTLNEEGYKISREFSEGTVLVSIAASIGATGILTFKSCFPDSLVGITTQSISTAKYIELFLRTQRQELKTQSYASGGQSNISLPILQKLIVPLPPLAEQEQIVAEVEARLSNIAQMEVMIENNLKRAEQERQSILHKAVAGRLVPQDPEDEPASKLLERIREERKKREEAEKIARASRKRIQMESTKKRQVGKTSLYKKLVEAKRPLPPDDLFVRAGLKVDEQPESVEAFYKELHANENVLIRETRPDDAHVLLEALEPSAEMLARMAEEEAAGQAQEAEQSEITIDEPRLWRL